MIKIPPLLLMFLSVVQASAQHSTISAEQARQRLQIAGQMEKSIRTELLNKWYPRSVDTLYGGFLSTFTFDFQPTGPQDKMIVTQSRHVWSNSRAAELYKKTALNKNCAEHGFKFLRDVMWDKTYGGFYTLVDRKGNVKDPVKIAYGNAFAIYALAAYYKMSKNKVALQLAKDGFMWLEQHSHDSLHQGYFQHLQRDGTPMKRTAGVPSTSNLGYKDQNSSIHLLEAFTELYSVWPDPLLRKRLQEMLFLIRDVITDSKGDLVLFFQTDWTPVSFKDSSEVVILKHRYLDHASFGHDVETAWLMMEASEALGLKKDTKTLSVSKRMVDHALRNGWDAERGGFYDEGYYFKNKPGITITKNTKNWWAQAEGLNTLLFMSERIPHDSMQYFEKFTRLWNYVQTYVIDHEYGDWYEEGLDNSPNRKTGLKGHIWKATYHQLRSLINCTARLRHDN